MRWLKASFYDNYSLQCWSKLCGYSLVLLHDGAHIVLCYECKSLIFFFRCISQSPSCNHLSPQVIGHLRVIIQPLGDIVYLFCFSVRSLPPVLFCTWFRGKHSKYKPSDSHFYSFCVSGGGVSVGLPCRLWKATLSETFLLEECYNIFSQTKNLKTKYFVNLKHYVLY